VTKEIEADEENGVIKVETILGRGLYLFALRRLLSKTLKALEQHLFVAICQLSGSGELIQPAAVGSPLIVVKVNHAAPSSDSLASRSAPIQ
jgi:hypothetical protein